MPGRALVIGPSTDPTTRYVVLCFETFGVPYDFLDLLA